MPVVSRSAPAELGVSSGGACSPATAGSADLKPKCWSAVMERPRTAALG